MVVVIGIGLVVATVWVIAYGMASGSHAEELWSSLSLGVSRGEEDTTTRFETRHAA